MSTRPDPNEWLSSRFQLREFLRSQTAVRHGIDMTPPPEVVDNLRRLSREVLQPLRDQLGRLDVSSGYRPPALNTRIGGSDTSAHVYGCAADIESLDLWPINIANCAAQMMARGQIVVDQLILEFGGWVHIGIAKPGQLARGQILTAARGEHGVVYRQGLHDVKEAAHG